jgi:serine/threonine protein kinase
VYKCLVNAEEAQHVNAGETENPSTMEGVPMSARSETIEDTVLDSLPSCILGLEELFKYRDRRDKLVRDIVFSVGLVTKVFKLRDVQPTKRRTSSTADSGDAERRQSRDDVSPRITMTELDFSRFGSPFRENGLSSSALVMDSKSFIPGEDMQLQLWQKLSELSVECEDDSLCIDATASTPRDGRSHNGSALLHEAIEQDRRRMLSVQQAIRKSAESDQSENFSSLIEERASIAKSSMNQVAALEKHLTKIKDMYDSIQGDLLAVINQLEDTKREHHNAFLQPVSWQSSAAAQDSISSNRTSDKTKRCAWEHIMCRSSDIIHLSNDSANEGSILELRECFEEIGLQSQNFAHFLGRSPSSFQISYSHDCNTVVSRLTGMLVKQRQLSAAVVETTQKELTTLRVTLDELQSLLKDAVTEGIDMVQLAYSQCMATSTEISRLYEDMTEWEGQLQRWQDPAALKMTCESMVSEVALLEEALLQWENQRIDIKSALEKAMLTMNRSKFMRPHSDSSAASASGSVGMEVERLRIQLSLAEREAKSSRRALRTWYRSHRYFAVNTAPELFFALPDFRSPGSVLGDGGFASSANIPRRQLSEYDDVVVFTNPELLSVKEEALGDIGKTGTGRHLLLKGSYEGHEVILKGFAMHNNEQRKGMDREIEILSRLKSDLVIHPQAIVDASSDSSDPTLQITLFIEYPFYSRGNLVTWLKQEERKPWELQSIARQILFAIMYLHDHGIVHKDIKPSNILMRDDGRIVLTDFELARVVAQSLKTSDGLAELDDEVCTVTRSGTSGYMAPEVEAGQSTGLSSDMFSFGCLLFFIHFPREFAQLVPSQVSFPRDSNADADLCDLIQRLLSVDPLFRPTAASALSHSYFRATFVDRLMQEGEIVEQDRKLDAVRNLLSRTRAANRNSFDRISISRSSVVEDVLKYFQEVSLDNLRKHLKVTFVNEPGVDEGGLLTEMFNLFFDQVFRSSVGLFEDCNHALSASASLFRPGILSTESSTDAMLVEEGTSVAEGEVILPSQHVPAEQLIQLRAVGRAMVKALYEGRRIGNRLCPSVLKFFTGAAPTIMDLQLYDAQAAKSLRWLLTTGGVEDLGMHFEEVGQSNLGTVNDSNKAQYVRLKIQNILVDSRLPQLTAIKAGFMEALQALSTEAAPFLTLLSHTDWRIMLCGDTVINAHQIISALKFSNFPRRSKISLWLTEILLSFSEDYLRKFLVFVTGSPSLSSSFNTNSSSAIKINVRHQTRSAALPTAHTCFYYLDIPDYDDRVVFQSKLIFAIQNANTFEIV